MIIVVFLLITAVVFCLR